MAKIKHYPYVAVHSEIGVDNTKITIYPNGFVRQNDKPIAIFWIPTSSLYRKPLWVPTEIIKARAKHDFKFTFGHHSGLNTCSEEYKKIQNDQINPAIYEEEKDE